MVSFCSLLLSRRVFTSCFAYEVNGTEILVTGVGETNETVGSVVRLYSVETVHISEGIVGIGSNSFIHCSTLQSVSLPDSVKSLGFSCFEFCTRLESIKFSENIKLENITSRAFYNCYSLVSFFVPSQVSRVDPFSFYGTKSLNKITVSTKNSNYIVKNDEYLYDQKNKQFIVFFSSKEDLNIESNELNQGIFLSGLFESSNIRTFRSSIKIIPESFFSSSINLETVELNQAESIERNSFLNCIHLTTISLSKQLKFIGSHSFCNCISLKTISLPSSLTTLENAFKGCISLESIIVPTDSHFKYHNFTIYQNNTLVVFIPNQKTNTNLIIPENINTIQEDAFSSCFNLESIHFNTELKHIPNDLFIDCEQLSSIYVPENNHNFIIDNQCLFSNNYEILYKYFSKTEQIYNIPDNVTIISSKAFSHSSSLKIVSIPSSVDEIGDNIFFNCPLLENISVEENIYYSTQDNVLFYNNSNLISYPCGKKSEEYSVPISTTVISKHSFSCSNPDFKLHKLYLEHNVESIDISTFQSISNLNEITVSPNNNHFKVSEGILFDFKQENIYFIFNSSNHINIPNSVYSISDYSFSNQCNITQLTIPTTTRVFTPFVQPPFSTLEKVIFSHSTTSPNFIHSRTSQFLTQSKIQSIIISSGITHLDNYCFQSFNYVEEIIIPNSILTIGCNVFSHCSKLSNVFIGSNLSSIGMNCFENCNLKKIDISPNNIHYIYSNHFLSDQAITTLIWFNKTSQNISTIELPSTIQHISSKAFSHSLLIEHIILPNQITILCAQFLEGCSKLNKVSIPQSLTEIGPRCFKNCTSLSTITLPQGITKISEETFSGCLSLRNITIEGNIQILSAYCFYNCQQFERIKLPSVEKIYESSFENCCQLCEISIGPYIQHLGMKIFKECKSLQIIYFCSSFETHDTSILEGVPSKLIIEVAIDYIPNDFSGHSVNRSNHFCLPVYPTPQPTMNYNTDAPPKVPVVLNSVSLTIGIAVSEGVLLLIWIVGCVYFAMKGKFTTEVNVGNNEAIVA